MIWKEVPEFPGYEVSEHGYLRRDCYELTPERVQGSGRKRFTLIQNGKSVRKHAAHLVALAFIGPKPFEGAEVCHKDDFSHNNHYSNLRWGTHESNVAEYSKNMAERKARSTKPMTRQQMLSAEAAQFLADAQR